MSETFLSEKLGIEIDKVKDICKFWERKGILGCANDHWKVLETREVSIIGKVDYIHFIEEEEHFSETSDNELDLSPLIPFITGMLTNLGPLDVNSMYSTLSMLNIISFSVGELSDFLEKSDFVQVSGSKYVLK